MLDPSAAVQSQHGDHGLSSHHPGAHHPHSNDNQLVDPNHIQVIQAMPNGGHMMGGQVPYMHGMWINI